MSTENGREVTIEAHALRGAALCAPARSFGKGDGFFPSAIVVGGEQIVGTNGRVAFYASHLTQAFGLVPPTLYVPREQANLAAEDADARGLLHIDVEASEYGQQLRYRHGASINERPQIGADERERADAGLWFEKLVSSVREIPEVSATFNPLFLLAALQAVLPYCYDATGKLVHGVTLDVRHGQLVLAPNTERGHERCVFSIVAAGFKEGDEALP